MGQFGFLRAEAIWAGTIILGPMAVEALVGMGRGLFGSYWACVWPSRFKLRWFVMQKWAQVGSQTDPDPIVFAYKRPGLGPCKDHQFLVFILVCFSGVLG